MANASCCTFDSPIFEKVLPPILFLEFVFGLSGNVLALWMFAFHMDSWRPSSIYLAHLAVADSLVLFCLPFRADYYSRGMNWILGDAFCRILLFLLSANRTASIFFLTAVAVDRYLKIVHSLNRINRMGLSYALWVSCGLWVIIIAMTVYLLPSPHFVSFNNRTQCESFNICLQNDPQANWHNAFYVIQFFVPAIIVVFCTVCITKQLKNKTIDTQGKVKRAVQFIFIVAGVFIVCFFPSTASRITIWILQAWYQDCEHFHEVNLAFYISVCLTYFNSVLNPLVYYFSTPAFRGTLQKLIMKLRWKKTENNNDNQTITCDTS
ncbi:hydroxycarboxylic acid receptor 2-like [Electrophorus electricus]|uniref:hydroxycarboxylic acid receptor 2-like n=1 Tax=Electrophorus electricus TaxID=8005 RepID=UPI0015CFF682|nr:hydroxycarboxylic acid receptor 2-like [Electrophorus electricus]